MHNVYIKRKVISERYGNGIISEQSKTHLTVFFEHGRTREMAYPECFRKGYIALANEDGEEDEASFESLMDLDKITPVSCTEHQQTVKSFKSVDGFVNEFEDALAKEIKEIKTGGKSKHYISLRNGELIERKNSRYLYSFESDAELHFPDDIPITIRINGEELSGTLVTVVDFTVIIATHAYWEGVIRFLEILASPWQLLEELENRLDAVVNDPSPLVEELVTGGQDAITADGVIRRNSDAAIEMSLTQPITFVWGPPGTGKTQTLARIVLKHIGLGHRVLMVSHSNVSVDGAMLRVKTLGRGYVPGRILRYGYPRDKAILEDDTLTSYNLALGMRPELKKERDELVSERSKLSRSDRRYAAIAERLQEIRDELEGLEKLLVSRAKFVATTISKAVVDPTIYESEFEVVLFDEASMAYIPQVVFAASLATSHFVCLGDYKQLPPIVQSADNSILEADVFGYCGISQAVHRGKGHRWLCLLDTQHRMHPQIDTNTQPQNTQKSSQKNTKRFWEPDAVCILLHRIIGCRHRHRANPCASAPSCEGRISS